MDLETEVSNASAATTSDDVAAHYYTAPLEISSPGTSKFVDAAISTPHFRSQHVPHIPYILNGELYEIQTQDGENVTVKCCHCPPDRVYRGSVRSTGNFHMHIKRRHPDLLGKLHDMKVNALLERRDRLMQGRRDRKVPHRSSRSSGGVKRETQSSLAQTQAAPPSLMHTHKLKIRTAFQRHQLQQQQALRNQWTATPFVVVPIANVPEVPAEPINYSLKESYSQLQCTNEITTCEQMERGSDHNDLVVLQSQSSSQINFTEIDRQAVPTSECSNLSFLHNRPPTYEIATASITPCPSSISSYESNISVGQTNYNSLAIIKNEHCLMPPDQAIDLSMQSSSLSSSSGIESGNTSFSSTNSNTMPTNLKWDDILLQVETSLRDIQREMRTRNQIETNRIFLDIAKFKYLNPGFNFNC